MIKSRFQSIRVVELYAGTARSVEPFRSWRRAEISLLVDANAHAKDTYLRNFSTAPYVQRDLLRTTSADLAELVGGRIDVLLGCPPCQGFSESGLRDESDPRNRHVSRFTTYALELKPRVVCMENVPLVATSSQFRRMVRKLERAEYQWSAMIANSAQYGSCQSRQRLLFMAFRKDLKCTPCFSKPTHGGNERLFSYSAQACRATKDDPIDMLGISPAAQRVAHSLPKNFLMRMGSKPAPTVGEIIGDLPGAGSKRGKALNHEPWQHMRATLRRMERVGEGGQWRGSADHYYHTYGRLHRKGLARTITASFAYAGSGRFWHPTENRSLTLREAARIQGFSDDFLFAAKSKSSAALIGNALDSALASICYRVIRSALE